MQKTRIKLSFIASSLCLNLLCSPEIKAQAVLASGATPTNVITAPSGKIQVDIAPVTGNGLSINSYTTFSVPSAGVDLNNRLVNANTIINQVIGTNRSMINGALEVLGTRAHVVLVNPNGITVDNGRFINTGGVALSAGSLRYSGGNPVLNTGTGDVTITGQGLSGAMTSLQLIASRLRIDGPVTNTNIAPNADIALVAGNHDVTLDATLQANSSLRAWASRTDLGGNPSDPILIDVTSRGSLAASKVELAVSARGAGVAFAGNGQASIGGFTINANGLVTLNGADIRAEKSAKIAATHIEVLNAPARQSTIQSLSGAITLLASAGDIDLRGSLLAKRRDNADPDSLGAITLGATGAISLLSENADRLAIAFAESDDLVIRAGGKLTNNTGRLLSNNNVTIQASQVDNQIDIVGAQNNGVPQISISKGRSHWFTFGRFKKKSTFITQNYGQLRIPNQLAYIVGQSVTIQTGLLRNKGEIDSQTGALIIRADNIENVASQTGALSFQKHCGLVCQSRGWAAFATAGGAMNAASGMVLTASGSILNEGGQIVSYGNMIIDAPAIMARAMFLPNVVIRPSGFNNLFAGPSSWSYAQQVGGQFISPNGSIIVQSVGPVLIDGGELLAGSRVDNPAGFSFLRHAAPLSPVKSQHIGLMRGWF